MKPETKYSVHTYSNLEEQLNIWSHFAGLLLSVVGLVLLIFRATDLENIWAIISFPMGV